MTHLKLIQGQRRELEFQFLTALFTPGGHTTAEALKKRLMRPAKGKFRVVDTALSSPPRDLPPSS